MRLHEKLKAPGFERTTLLCRVAPGNRSSQDKRLRVYAAWMLCVAKWYNKGVGVKERIFCAFWLCVFDGFFSWFGIFSPTTFLRGALHLFVTELQS
jgi:hypothetical protein